MNKLTNAYDLSGACSHRLQDYPLYSQEKKSDPVVGVKLFHPFGSGTWFLTEYDPEEKLAFGYATGLACDEWGYVSIAELESVTFHGVQTIEVDLSFSPKRLSEIEECRYAIGRAELGDHAR